MTYQPVGQRTATYAACIGTPGCLPMMVEGDFASIAEAWQFLADERERELDAFRDTPVEQDQTWIELSQRIAEQQCGGVYGPSPNGSDNDLGLVYEVIPEVEE